MDATNYPGYKPKKKIEKNSRGYGLKQIAKMTLGSGNLEIAVELPEGEDLNEWLAVNTIEFYNDSIKFFIKMFCNYFSKFIVWYAC
jgi:hypothetical protein